MKREPLLADKLLATSITWAKQYDKTAKSNLLTAKRFVLDREAAQYIGNMVHDVPRILADANDFAIPPFENMWVEMPFDAYFEAVNKVPNVDYSGRFIDGEDMQWGMLIRGSSVRVAAGGGTNNQRHTNDGIFGPIEYLLHRPPTFEENYQFRSRFSFSRLTYNQLLWGASYQDLSENAADAKHVLSESHTLRYVESTLLDPKIAAKKGYTQGDVDLQAADIMMQGAGDLRNIIAILLFLNRTQDIQIIHEVGPKQGFIGNHLRPYLKHNVITLKVDPTPRFKRMTAGHGAFKRLHDVRGHFCHNRQARESNCMHPDWEETDEGRQWQCVQCKGLKWWRHEHRRGHEEKGIVTSEYQVKK